MEIYNAIQSVDPVNSKATGPILDECPDDVMKLKAKPFWPKMPKNYKYAPQRWMFRTTWLTRKESWLGHIVPVDEPTSNEDVVNSGEMSYTEAKIDSSQLNDGPFAPLTCYSAAVRQIRFLSERATSASPERCPRRLSRYTHPMKLNSYDAAVSPICTR
jgi:hypothetical protein